MVKFFCAIIGVAGSAFPVDIDASLSVGDLKNAIKGKNDDIKCTARELQLFLAKKEKGAGAWLTEDEAAAVSLDEGGHLQGFKMMKSSLYLKNPKHFGSNFQSDEDQVHVLVVVPDQAQPQTGLWLVTASVENALNTKGIRCRLYRLMASYLGYYDPVRRTGDKDTALWYEDKTLCIHSIFKSEENALLFDNVLQDECITQTSPLDGHDVSTNVAPVSRQLSELRRIYSRHYAPQDTESPQVSMLSISTNTSIVDVMTDEFKYQRIESEEWFGDVGKAQSCHLMSRDHCRKCPSDRKYDNDPNNRLALSSAMHDWYDGRMYNVPVMNISVESVSERPVIGNRYKVNLIVRALNARYAKWISLILKEGFVASEDSLEMHTCVYVQNPKVFCVCMEWKRKEIDKQWNSYYDMEPAVD